MYKKGFCRAGIAAVMMFSSMSWGKSIAIIDSGYNPESKIVLCEKGHYDFTVDKPIAGTDTINHGSIISLIISNYTDACQVILKAIESRTQSKNYISDAIEHAIKLKVDAINLSVTGTDFDEDEYYALNKAVKAGIRVFVPSGNKGHNLNKKCNIYPACYKVTDKLDIIVVGSKEDYRANTGKIVDEYEAFCYAGECGTSMSAAFAAGKFLQRLRIISKDK